jgi:hypothetical protein
VDLVVRVAGRRRWDLRCTTWACPRTYPRKALKGRCSRLEDLMSETIKSATAPGTDDDSAVFGAAVTRQPPNGGYTGKLLVVMNGALVGVPSAYAMSNSLLVTAIAAALAGWSAAVLLAAQWTRCSR